MDKIRYTLRRLSDDWIDSADCRNHRGEDPVDRRRANHHVGVGVVVSVAATHFPIMARSLARWLEMEIHAVGIRKGQAVGMSHPSNEVVIVEFRPRVPSPLIERIREFAEKIQPEIYLDEPTVDWRGLSHCIRGRIAKPYSRIYKPPIRYRGKLINPPPL